MEDHLPITYQRDQGATCAMRFDFDDDRTAAEVL
jgi:hypothetical protein